ncbi:unnamed protein product, partial [Prorocentrum cordatum]
MGHDCSPLLGPRGDPPEPPAVAADELFARQDGFRRRLPLRFLRGSAQQPHADDGPHGAPAGAEAAQLRRPAGGRRARRRRRAPVRGPGLLRRARMAHVPPSGAAPAAAQLLQLRLVRPADHHRLAAELADCRRDAPAELRADR